MGRHWWHGGREVCTGMGLGVVPFDMKFTQSVAVTYSSLTVNNDPRPSNAARSALAGTLLSCRKAWTNLTLLVVGLRSVWSRCAASAQAKASRLLRVIVSPEPDPVWVARTATCEVAFSIDQRTSGQLSNGTGN